VHVFAEGLALLVARHQLGVLQRGEREDIGVARVIAGPQRNLFCGGGGQGTEREEKRHSEERVGEAHAQSFA